jgi:uncharacterized protein
MSDGRLALITGATSGIGAVFAERLAADGHDLILTGRREQKIEAIADELRLRHGIGVRVVLAELSDPADLDALVALVEATPDLEMLVNNAGFASRGQFHTVPFQTHDRMIDVHARALVRLTHAALPGMVGKNRGSIVNVSSIASFIPYPGNAMYSATKAFVTNFSETLHLELKATNVRVQALCPGLTRTDFHARLGAEFDNPQAQRALARAMTPEHVVDCSLKSLARNQAVCVPGLNNRFRAAVLRTLPRSIVSRIIGAVFGDGTRSTRP